uniref:Uncharacterized protein n=1 Tax=viral metagenome TaxID=1070528 RepID=A0A6M3L2H2_9ZZZZ
MTYQERLDEIEDGLLKDTTWRLAEETADGAIIDRFAHVVTLCRELIAKLSDDRDRLRRRDEVVREWLRQDEEMAGYGAGLADRLAVIEEEKT